MATWKVTTQEIDGVKTRGIILPDVNQDDFDHPASAALGAVVTKASDGQIESVEIPEKRFIPFWKPGRRLETKAIVTVKAVTPDGRLIQIPLEDQINNHVASPETGLGLQGYIRKGFTVFWDPQTGQSAFCQTWGCYAEANYKDHGGYCSEVHAGISKPKVNSQGFSMGATTSTRWAGSA